MYIKVLFLVAIIVNLCGCNLFDPKIHDPIVNDVDYRGHHYIVFRVTGQHGQTYVHDPDCKCMVKYESTK